jgi:hypothetical protein
MFFYSFENKQRFLWYLPADSCDDGGLSRCVGDVSDVVFNSFENKQILLWYLHAVSSDDGGLSGCVGGLGDVVVYSFERKKNGYCGIHTLKALMMVVLVVLLVA